ncbi:cobalamin biosynthesis protein CbiD [Desulfarculus baarsii DSM 2075]|uniref:Cobalt-precorrin-5B C(1)-methyltransferase n=1 Tax=Desulfarculus baarsii (strain ATCC 33931 / DSM 2075 / LMG 7858 / VKM B-1802 / 2st14) TaxID=644282 RepID=E1QJS7_DESB2|nr:cobalt-precorrin-5B (C(1))-methyltransferase [Desulfarculus baarsii]ADK85820.1 cobalamin biosynthesis protein CbiD [Desulfarculus baarsii DSM 2075]
MNSRRLRTGFSTGTAAAAAAKAATLTALGQAPAKVEVSLPDGGRLEIAVSQCRLLAPAQALAVVIKDAGDDPDVTNKAAIRASVRLLPAGDGAAEVRVLGGDGVGLVTRPGLPVAPGAPAINPVPRQMIEKAVRQAVAWAAPGATLTAEVVVSVAGGQELARHTLNPRLGVVGGISILGTTGLVKPFSHQAYTETIDLCLSVATAAGLSEVVLTTGGKSEKWAQALRPDLPEAAMIQIADFFGYALAACAKAGLRQVGLVSFFGKAVKQASGLEYTHARQAVMDLAQLAEWLGQAGLDQAAAQSVAQANTARHALDLLRELGRLELVSQVGRRMLTAAEHWAGPGLRPWAVVLDYDGQPLWDSRAQGGQA